MPAITRSSSKKEAQENKFTTPGSPSSSEEILTPSRKGRRGKNPTPGTPAIMSPQLSASTTNTKTAIKNLKIKEKQQEKPMSMISCGVPHPPPPVLDEGSGPPAGPTAPPVRAASPIPAPLPVPAAPPVPATPPVPAAPPVPARPRAKNLYITIIRGNPFNGNTIKMHMVRILVLLIIALGVYSTSKNKPLQPIITIDPPDVGPRDLPSIVDHDKHDSSVEALDADAQFSNFHQEHFMQNAYRNWDRILP